VGQRILIAEDDRPLRYVIRRALESVEREYEVAEADDGAAALEQLRGGRFDIVLTDLSMPGLDGFELLKALTAEFLSVPVVVITALGDDNSIRSCLACGAWDYLIKPFDNKRLLAIVRRALVVAAEVAPAPGDVEVGCTEGDSLVLTVASEMEYVQRFRRFSEILLESRLPPSVREDLRMAVEEIGRNAVEWGNCFDRSKKVKLSYRLEPDRVVFCVEDDGAGFKPHEVPDPSADPIGLTERREKDGKRPGGFGIHIIQGVMDKVEYNERGNAVTLTKFLP
jgi:CheY-like chemotaxis protein/anti-sigma regulatory factor (Ser/Thr protein kinase)